LAERVPERLARLPFRAVPKKANDPRESSPHAWVFLNSRGAGRRSARISVRFVGRWRPCLQCPHPTEGPLLVGNLQSYRYPVKQTSFSLCP